MKERQIELIKNILYSSSPLSIEELIDNFSVSERAIKYDIADIRDELNRINVELINKKGLGYYFSPDAKPTLIDYFALSDYENTLKNDQTDMLPIK